MAIILFFLCLSQCDCMASPIKRWGPLLSSPETQLALWRMQWEYQRANPGPGPGTQEAPHASTHTPGSLPTPCVKKPGPACQRMKHHMKHGRDTQLKPLRPVSPNQPSHWPQLPMWAQPWLEGSPSPVQIVEPQNGEWINRCFKPTQFVMQQKLTDTVGIYVYRKLWMQKWYVFVFCDGKSIRLSKCEKSSNTVEAG